VGAYGVAVFLAAVGLYGAALGGHLANWQETLTARAQTALVTGGFGINAVIVKGRQHLTQARLTQALDTSRAQTIFGFDTRAAKARLERVGWVKSARVMRLWPSTLVVELKERQPFARWEIRGHKVLIDKHGALLGPVTPEFGDLPRVAGEGADRKAASLLAALERHDAVGQRVLVARRIERRRWDLRLETGMRVQLPARRAEGALPTVARLLDGRIPEHVSIIDLRVDGRIALRRGEPESDAPGATAQLPSPSGREQARPL